VLTPRYVQDSETLIKAAKRILNYRKDVAAPDQLEAARAGIAQVRTAIKQRSAPAVKEAEKPLVEVLTKIDPPRSNSWIRDNVELIVVVVAIALGLRAFYLQPFKIPTGSMQPTLSGIIAKRLDGPAPNFLVQAFQFVALGRTYADVVSEEDNDSIADISPAKLRFIWDGALIRMTSGRAYTVGVAPEVLEGQLGLRPSYFEINPQLGKKYQKGEPIVRAYADLGDQVFVDKVSYNFFPPHRGDIFVFKTNGIAGIGQSDGPSEHFIKRLAGVPGNSLRIDEPNLFINGEPASNFVFQRVESRKNGYTGYTNQHGQQEQRMRYLATPTDTVTIPPESYFALGDNSANSLDSRYWGFVPAENVVGKGLFVYWPFTSHWGFPR
jgi:signal peptidase I